MRSLVLFPFAAALTALVTCRSARQSELGSSGAAGAGGASATASAGGSGAVSEPGLLFIQEDEPGFSGFDGKILPRQGSTSISGYTGTGFADGDPGVGNTLGFSVSAETAGRYAASFRYAFGGDAANVRDARLLVNGRLVSENFTFPFTEAWDAWRETTPVELELEGGVNFIQLEALAPAGLANVDYFRIEGEGLAPGEAQYSLRVEASDPEAGTVSFEPAAGYYAAGASITVSASPSAGHFFQSWTGDVTSDSADHTFAIERNTRITARFLPEGTAQPPGLVGYATVQDDEGTPYIVTGGSLGASVTASTLEQLEAYLESPEPLVVSFDGTFEGTQSIAIASNKTLLGVGAAAHLRGVELAVSDQRNVIIQNVAVSHVVADGSGEANDAIVLSNAKNVWIDHCELFSDRDHGKDYYDGLLEIKNASAFITVSWTVLRDHYKVSLISSGEEQVGDAAIRATYHHDYFLNCGSRLPSIRFGQAHLYNNYYQNNLDGSCINSRMGAVVKVENNYFQSSKDTIGSWDSPLVGTWEVSNNLFDACSGAQPTTSTGSLTVPYAYELDDPANVPSAVTAGAGVGKL